MVYKKIKYGVIVKNFEKGISKLSDKEIAVLEIKIKQFFKLRANL